LEFGEPAGDNLASPRGIAGVSLKTFSTFNGQRSRSSPRAYPGITSAWIVCDRVTGVKKLGAMANVTFAATSSLGQVLTMKDARQIAVEKREMLYPAGSNASAIW
jgi:hypothetical protein